MLPTPSPQLTPLWKASRLSAHKPQPLLSATRRLLHGPVSIPSARPLCLPSYGVVWPPNVRVSHTLNTSTWPCSREARRCRFLWWECCPADSIWLFRAHRWGPIISRGMLCSLRPGHHPPAPTPPELAFIAKSLLSVLQQEITQQLKSGCPAQLRNPGIDASVTRLGVTRVSARPLRPAPTCFLTWNPGPSLFPGLQIHGLMQSMSRMWPVGPEMAPAGQDPSHAGSVRWWASQPGAAWTGWSRLIFSQEPGRLTGILAVNTAYHSQVEAKGDEAGNGFHSSKADTSWEGYPGEVGGLMCGESRCFSLMRI